MTSHMNTENVTFDNEELMKTVKSLEELDIKCLKNVNKGTFGHVVEVSHPNYSENLAAKFVLSSHFSIGEHIIWKKLSHKNIVQLLECHYFENLKTSVFLMHFYKHTLYDMTSSEGFRRNESGFSRAAGWSRDVISGLSYLHEHGICHLDVKSNNVLIDASDVALLSDFGYSVKPLTLVERYGTPYVYRPPEAITTAEGMSLVDGFALDKWTAGILLLELFSCHTLMKIKRSINKSNIKWSHDIYPEMYSILQVDRFKVLLNVAFMNSKVSSGSVYDVLDVIKSTLCIDPNARPEMREILTYPLFGGKVAARKGDAIWKSLMESKMIEVMVGRYAPNPLLGIEELLEIRKSKYELSSEELDSDECGVPSTEIEPDEYSPDVNDDFGEQSGQNENVLQKDEKKMNRYQRFLGWMRRKRMQIGDLFSSCTSRCLSRNQ